MAIGLLVLRVVLGLTLAAHGAQKLFGWFGGPGLSGAGSFLESIGFVPGRLQALVAGLAEAGGGLLLALGLLTPLAAAISLAVTGPGALSLDAVLGLPFAGARWGLAALAVGAIGGALPLLTRRQIAAPAA